MAGIKKGRGVLKGTAAVKAFRTSGKDLPAFLQHLAAFGSIWQHLAAKCAIRAPRRVAYGLGYGAAKCSKCFKYSK